MKSNRVQAGPDKIGLIAGNGVFPLIFADTAKERGLSVVAVAHTGETEPSLSEKVDDILWIRVGQVGKLISYFKKSGVSNAVMAGGIRKTRIFEVRPDLRALSLLARLKEKKDDALLRAVAEELERENIKIKDPTAYLTPLLAGEGEFTRPLKKGEKEDIRWGWKLAKKVGLLDIGQCVVVRNGVILAVEAIEGTDATILRGGKLGKENVVVIKICKPQQDLRFDMPTVGPETIRNMIKVKASVLALETGKTLILEKDQFMRDAKSAGIAVVGYPDASFK
ncbi:MAG: UDP-2,3-diacylglucosamine diphosphatase LpxI [Nitrospira sp.]|nr:LpxI family protein [Candidatus Manganitrophaceae bacterium]HIL35544.1 LpxI family protein [Candidatus Manganitrophaceae bacterium]